MKKVFLLRVLSVLCGENSIIPADRLVMVNLAVASRQSNERGRIYNRFTWSCGRRAMSQFFGHAIYFPPYHISADVDLLYRSESVVPLQPQAVRCLRYLAEHHDRVVSKEELLSRVWTDAFKTEGVLKKAILQIVKKQRQAVCVSQDKEMHC